MKLNINIFLFKNVYQLNNIKNSTFYTVILNEES